MTRCRVNGLDLRPPPNEKRFRFFAREQCRASDPKRPHSALFAFDVALEEPKLSPFRASELRLKLDLIRPSGSGNRRAVVDRNAATRCGERTIWFHVDVLAWFPPSRS